jgi:hypothetical protein
MSYAEIEEGQAASEFFLILGALLIGGMIWALLWVAIVPPKETKKEEMPTVYFASQPTTGFYSSDGWSTLGFVVNGKTVATMTRAIVCGEK